MIKKQYYKAQILAVVLVLLILAAIVAFAMFVRVTANKSAVLQERSFSDADNLTDSLVSDLGDVDYSDIVDYCDKLGQSLETGCSVSGSLDNQSLVSWIETLTGNTIDDLIENFGFCENVSVDIKYAGSDEIVTIDSDKSLQIDINEANPASCGNLILTFPAGTYPVNEGFALFKLYGQVDHNSGKLLSLDEYQLEDVEGLCFMDKNSATTCFRDGGVNIGNSGDVIYSIPIQNPNHSNPLYAIRVHAYNSPISLRWSFSNSDCKSNWIKVTVSATCQGEFSGKSFLIPPSFTTPSIFDYTLINNVGVLEPI